MLAILDDKLLFIHGHSVKGIERVVRMRTRRQGDLDDEHKTRSGVKPESAMFCTHLSHFRYAVRLLPEWRFFYRACDEEMPKTQLVLTLLKIIS